MYTYTHTHTHYTHTDTVMHCHKQSGNLLIISQAVLLVRGCRFFPHYLGGDPWPSYFLCSAIIALNPRPPRPLHESPLMLLSHVQRICSFATHSMVVGRSYVRLYRCSSLSLSALPDKHDLQMHFS